MRALRSAGDAVCHQDLSCADLDLVSPRFSPPLAPRIEAACLMSGIVEVSKSRSQLLVKNAYRFHFFPHHLVKATSSKRPISQMVSTADTKRADPCVDRPLGVDLWISQ